MVRTPIAQLKDGMSLDQSFQAADKQLRVNRQGGKYILLKLADRSGTIAAMMWNADEAVLDRFDRADFVHISGRTQIHNGALQIIATDIHRMDPSEVSTEDFERFDAAKSDALMVRLKTLMQSLTRPPLQALAKAYLSDDQFVLKLKKAAAAVNNHHAYPGGLLQHTVDMMEMSQFIAERYEPIDGDLLMMGAFLHDLGKIDELRADGEISYTDRGQLVGHIVIGIQLLTDMIAAADRHLEGSFPVSLRHQLEHLIASHHGLLEYGSPKIPMTLEAAALHHIDNLDAKLTSYQSIIETDVAADGNWTNFNPSIGRKLWKADR
ncbi:MAG: HD domain-containing protein [Planctomycetota bacterium]